MKTTIKIITLNLMISTVGYVNALDNMNIDDEVLNLVEDIALEADGALSSKALQAGDLLAEVELDHGAVRFVVDGESSSDDFEVARWEYGELDLTAFDDEGATPLEIFLAIAPEGKNPPSLLIKHHMSLASKAFQPVGGPI